MTSPASIPLTIVDLSATTQIVGSEENALYFINIFTESIPETKQDCRAAVESKDAVKMRAICHKMKGFTSYFVAPNMFEKLTELRHIVRSEPDNTEKWTEAYIDFEKALDEFYTMCNGKLRR